MSFGSVALTDPPTDEGHFWSWSKSSIIVLRQPNRRIWTPHASRSLDDRPDMQHVRVRRSTFCSR
jgi:hypothetical protein